MKDKNMFLFILALYILLPVIILFNGSLYQYKFYILTIVGILILFVFRINKVKMKELGITKTNLSRSLKRNIPIILMCFVLIIVLKLLNVAKYSPTEGILFYLFYIFISCPIQEFLYRGVFGYFEKELIKNKWIILFLSSFCYSFVHIIYKDILTCILTFIFGIVLYYLYKKDYNLGGVSFSHIVLGILTIYLGIVN